MTTWTLPMIASAQRLRAALAVDAESLYRAPEAVREAAEGEMAAKLIDMGHPLGIELHRGDFEVTWAQRDDNACQVTGRMRWAPQTNTAELRGGHLDGQRYAIRKIGEPLRVERPAVTPWFAKDHESATAALTTTSDIYQLAGWREDERVWLYEA